MYQALISRVTITPHPNADKLQIANINGYQVITGADIKDGDLVVFFNEGGALSHEFCYHNNEYRVGKGQNKDPDKCGYFESNRRIRVIKLRGTLSEGYICPLSSLGWTGVDLSTLTEGTQFTDLNGFSICYKYVSIATQKAIQAAQKQGRIHYDIDTFPKHFDTKQLRDNIGRIPLGAILYLTAKVHGTSGRTGRHLVPKPLEKWQIKWNRLVKYSFLQFKPVKDWVYVSGSRNVTYDPFGEELTSYRKTAEDMLRGKLHKGETVYYEICYSNDSGVPLFTHPVGSSKEVKNDDIRKEILAAYGNTMKYTYGCTPKQTRIFIYRITGINAEGDTYEYAWHQVQKRARELGIETVPLIETVIYTTAAELFNCIKALSDKPSVIDPSHIEEGLCIRIEHPDISNNMSILKWKYPYFCTLEGIRKNDDNYVDVEEIA